MVMTDIERAYLAGIVDGDGHIGLMNRGATIRVNVTNTDLTLMGFLADRAGVGMVRLQSRTPTGNRQPAFQWNIFGEAAVQLLFDIAPFLLLKRERAVLALGSQFASRPESRIAAQKLISSMNDGPRGRARRASGGSCEVNANGCDIHLSVEVRTSEGWQNYDDKFPWKGEPFGRKGEFLKPDALDRDYAMFGILAGVRDERQEPIAEPRGFPSDAHTLSVEPREDEVVRNGLIVCHVSAADGDHSQSWLHLFELQRRADDLIRVGGPPWAQFLDDLAALGAPHDVRIVFSFDS